METIHQLMQQSAGVGAGIALGSAVGFGIRKHRTADAKIIRQERDRETDFGSGRPERGAAKCVAGQQIAWT